MNNNKLYYDRHYRKVGFSYTHEERYPFPQLHATKHLEHGAASALVFTHHIEGSHESNENIICKNRTKCQIIIDTLPLANVIVWTTDR